MNKLLTLVSFIAFLGLSSTVWSQCAVDVTITNGASIEMCEEAPVPITAANGYVSYDWTGPETLSGQTITPQFSGIYTVEAIDGVGCSSFADILVTINPTPTPTVVSSEGNPMCPTPGGTTLSTATPYVSYDWGAGNTGATFFAPSIGAYSVTVTDGKGCSGNGIITLTELSFDLTTIDQSGCEGGTVMLQASGGSSYLWSTGETGSSIVVAPASSTNYSVSITSGTCTETLSTTIEPVDVLDYELEDTLYLGIDQSANLSGPPGFDSYHWAPTDFISDSTAMHITVTAGESHTLTMTATHSSGCVLTENVVVIVVDLSIPTGFSPNFDGINDLFIIPDLYDLDASIVIWNRWGDIVLDESHYENDWDGTCKTGFCLGKGQLPEGTYFYRIESQGVNFDGYITLKR